MTPGKKKVETKVVNLSLNEEGARIVHRLLKAEAQKPEVEDEVLRTWFRLDGTMKRRGLV